MDSGGVFSPSSISQPSSQLFPLFHPSLYSLKPSGASVRSFGCSDVLCARQREPQSGKAIVESKRRKPGLASVGRRQSRATAALVHFFRLAHFTLSLRPPSLKPPSQATKEVPLTPQDFRKDINDGSREEGCEFGDVFFFLLRSKRRRSLKLIITATFLRAAASFALRCLL